MKAYEVALYNRQVRDKVSVGERHKEFSDDWADMHYVTLKAFNPGDARSRALAKYPESKGFVIEDISEVID